MEFGDGRADDESKPEAALLGGKEWLECLIDLHGSHSRPLVPDKDLNTLVIDRVRADENPAPRRRDIVHRFRAIEN